MINSGEDLLICDLAETYGILNYSELIQSNPQLVATLAIGLSDNSRIKRELSGYKLTFEQTLMTMIYDSINILLWSKTKDAQKGRNKPKSLLTKLMDKEKKDELMSFDTPEEYEEYMMQKRREYNG